MTKRLIKDDDELRAALMPFGGRGTTDLPESYPVVLVVFNECCVDVEYVYPSDFDVPACGDPDCSACPRPSDEVGERLPHTYSAEYPPTDGSIG